LAAPLRHLSFGLDAGVQQGDLVLQEIRKLPAGRRVRGTVWGQHATKLPVRMPCFQPQGIKARSLAGHDPCRVDAIGAPSATAQAWHSSQIA
jgi:hypothetical protein